MSDLLWQKPGVDVDAAHPGLPGRRRRRPRSRVLPVRHPGQPRACRGPAAHRHPERRRAVGSAARTRLSLAEDFRSGALRARCALRGRPFGDRGAPDRAPGRRRPQDPHRPQPQRPGAGGDAPVAEGSPGARCRACAASRRRSRWIARGSRRRAADAGLHAPAARRGVVGRHVVGGLGRGLHRQRGSRATDAGLDRCQSAGHRRRLRRQPAAGSRPHHAGAGLRAAAGVADRTRSCRAASSRWRRIEALGSAPARSASPGLGPVACSPARNSASSPCRRNTPPAVRSCPTSAIPT